MVTTFEDAAALQHANNPTYSEAQVEEAVQAVLDHLLTTDQLLGYEDGELTPLDIAGRVLAHLKEN